MNSARHRIAHLDGLRGVAIMLVLMFHLWFYPASEILSFGSRFDFWLTHLGWCGVELFFLISGYVILLTLQRCRSFGDFMRRRWLRLFPAMAIATVLLLVADGSARAAGLPPTRLQDAIPGLTFVSPAIWHAVLRVPIGALDGSFWTLFVEAAFYVIYGSLYFRFGREDGWLLATMLLLALGLSASILPPFLDWAHAPALMRRMPEPLGWVGMEYFPWFAAGIVLARAKELGQRHLLMLGVLIGALAVLAASLGQHAAFEDRIAMGAMLLLFVVADNLRIVSRLLATRPLLFMGWASYPLYLVHEKIGLTCAWWWHGFVPRTPSVLLPLAGMAPALFLACWIAGWGEPALRRRLDASVPGGRAQRDRIAQSGLF